MLINTKIEIEVEGRDTNGFDVTKSFTDILFEDSDRVMDAETIAIRVIKGITSLKSKSVVTIHLYKGEKSRALEVLYKGEGTRALEAIRWTYEGYNGDEWMKRTLENNEFPVTENFVKNKDIKKDIVRIIEKMNLIQDLIQTKIV